MPTTNEVTKKKIETLLSSDLLPGHLETIPGHLEPTHPDHSEPVHPDQLEPASHVHLDTTRTRSDLGIPPDLCVGIQGAKECSWKVDYY